MTDHNDGPAAEQARFAQAVARFDQANAQDPSTVEVDGQSVPSELLYARRMSQWLERFRPDAPEALRLAARAQHIQRWRIPRERYPRDRQGYHRWRNELKEFHATTAAAILEEVGYPGQTVGRVAALLRKQNLRDDAETQCLEDVICLVFLSHYFEAFAERHPPGKLDRIVRKTWAKMSPCARETALAADLPGRTREIVGRALDGA